MSGAIGPFHAVVAPDYAFLHSQIIRRLLAMGKGFASVTAGTDSVLHEAVLCGYNLVRAARSVRTWTSALPAPGSTPSVVANAPSDNAGGFRCWFSRALGVMTANITP